MALKPFTMPKWGIEMQEGTIAEWMVAEDAPFAKGAMLALIETDKITNEVEAEADGRLVRIIATAGTAYPVGALLAVQSDGEAASAAEIDAVVAGFRQADTQFGDAAPVRQSDPEPATAEPPAGSPAAPAIPNDLAISPAARAAAISAGADVGKIAGTGRNGRITAQDVHQALRSAAPPALVGPLPPTDSSAFASPMAKRLAARSGIDLETLDGSGPHGRITKADVLAASTETDAPAVEIRPMTAMRRIIARRLTEAKTSIPHFYVRRRVRMDHLLALRAANGKLGSVNDWLLRACALALIEVPDVNIQVHGEDIHRFQSADIAVAVANERGLITPILFGAERLDIATISERMQALAAKARAGKLKLEEFSGGSFSLSNLGSHGVEQFDAIINPPQGAILAVGAARPEPVEDKGAIRIVPMLHMSLSCDHRAIDGADGGRFLTALNALIESPERLL